MEKLSNINFIKRTTIRTGNNIIDINPNNVKHNNIWRKYNKTDKLEKISLSVSYENDILISEDSSNDIITYLINSKIENVFYYSNNIVLTIYKKQTKVYKENKCIDIILKGPYSHYSTKNKDKKLLSSH